MGKSMRTVRLAKWILIRFDFVCCSIKRYALTKQACCCVARYITSYNIGRNIFEYIFSQLLFFWFIVYIYMIIRFYEFSMSCIFDYIIFLSNLNMMSPPLYGMIFSIRYITKT